MTTQHNKPDRSVRTRARADGTQMRLATSVARAFDPVAYAAALEVLG